MFTEGLDAQAIRWVQEEHATISNSQQKIYAGQDFKTGGWGLRIPPPESSEAGIFRVDQFLFLMDCLWKKTVISILIWTSLRILKKFMLVDILLKLLLCLMMTSRGGGFTMEFLMATIDIQTQFLNSITAQVMVIPVIVHHEILHSRGLFSREKRLMRISMMSGQILMEALASMGW